MRSGSVWGAVEEGCGVRPQGSCNPGHDQQAGVTLTALDTAHVCQVDVRLERELFLRQLRFLPQAANVLADNDAPIFHLLIGGENDYIL